VRIHPTRPLTAKSIRPLDCNHDETALLEFRAKLFSGAARWGVGPDRPRGFLLGTLFSGIAGGLAFRAGDFSECRLFCRQKKPGGLSSGISDSFGGQCVLVGIGISIFFGGPGGCSATKPRRGVPHVGWRNCGIM